MTWLGNILCWWFGTQKPFWVWDSFRWPSALHYWACPERRQFDKEEGKP